jgi:DNA topoisomerase-1
VPRQFSTKARNAQEAHEAIRPAGESFRAPSETGLDGRDLALYELIWKRTVASQMAEARLTMLAVDLEVAEARFRCQRQAHRFPWFLPRLRGGQRRS